MKTLSVIVPVYYNEKSLPLLFDQLCSIEGKLRDRNLAFELIFVDDGSGDGSFAELIKIKEARPATKVIRLSRNFGAVQASFKAGLRFVTGNCLVILAADLQDPPEMILEMVERWQAGAKFVMCVRRIRNDPFLSKLCAWLYYRMLRLLVAPSYPACGYDLALMDEAMLPHLRCCGRNVNPNVFAFWLGFQPHTIAYDRRERQHGRSRWTLVKKLKFFADTLLGFSALPLRIISCIGVLVATASGAYGVSILIHIMLGQQTPPGFSTIACLLVFLLGLTICMLGLIGEYLWRIYDQVCDRPDAVIGEIL